MSSSRKTALVAGVFFAITFLASIPALLLYDPVLNDTNYIVSAGADTRVSLGAFLEVITAIANIGTAVTLFPILKRQNEGVALGYVASRVLESTVIVVGLISLLSVVTLRQDVGGAGAADSGSLVIAGQSLVAFHDWTFLLGPAFCAGFGNGLLLGYLMYTSGLVPRRMALLGLIGGPLAFATADRRTVRGLRANLRGVVRHDTPGDRLGSVADHLPHRQRIQAISDPLGGREPCPADVLNPWPVDIHPSGGRDLPDALAGARCYNGQQLELRRERRSVHRRSGSFVITFVGVSGGCSG